MHGFVLMRAVSPSLNKSVFDLLLHQDEKRLCKNPTPRHMPDDRIFSHQQQRTNISRVIEQSWRGFEPERPMEGMQALRPTHSPYSATNARNQIRNKSALESRGSGAAPPMFQFWVPPTSFLDHTLSRVDAVLLSSALLSTILSDDNLSKRNISIIADSGSESVVPFARSR